MAVAGSLCIGFQCLRKSIGNRAALHFASHTLLILLFNDFAWFWDRLHDN